MKEIWNVCFKAKEIEHEVISDEKRLNEDLRIHTSFDGGVILDGKRKDVRKYQSAIRQRPSHINIQTRSRIPIIPSHSVLHKTPNPVPDGNKHSLSKISLNSLPQIHHQSQNPPSDYLEAPYKSNDSSRHHLRVSKESIPSLNQSFQPSSFEQERRIIRNGSKKTVRFRTNSRQSSSRNSETNENRAKIL